MAQTADHSPLPDDFLHKTASGSADASDLPPGFVVRPDGIYVKGGAGDPIAPRNICGTLTVKALSTTPDGRLRSKIVTFMDMDGREHERLVPLANFGPGTAKVVQSLRSGGLRVTYGADTDVARLLDEWIPAQRVIELDRYGWVGAGLDAFLTADGCCVGLDSYRCCNTTVETMPPSGTLDAWRVDVAAPCGNDPLAILALCCGLVGPLMRILDLPSCGVYFAGVTSVQGDLLMAVCRSVGLASVCTTALSGKALLRAGYRSQDGTFVLGELGAGNAPPIFKALDAAALGGSGDRKHYGRSFVVSFSPWSMAGMPVRRPGARTLIDGLIDIDGSACTLPTEVAQRIMHAAGNNHAVVGPAFLDWLLQTRSSFPTFAEMHVRLTQHFKASVDRENVVADRVASRLAAVALAGELATKAGLTGWQKADASHACLRLLCEWAARQACSGDTDANVYARQILDYAAKHAEQFADDAGSEGSAPRAGYRDTGHVYVLPRNWRDIFPDGAKKAAKALNAEGLLTSNSDGYQYRVPRGLDPKQPKVYALRLPAESPK
ncbi:DUF927 domain-containing protein [Ponticoccus sp. (in: a-proteobacteria)]|uniref:DUF927 domain-containing protein n=1 Tax=Ponticoccus sp. (in: a-proteobacteria) TaxID=1925025 RepID=UPI003AB5BC09